MNWLAHLLLSDPTPACRIGNLLPDMLPGRALSAFSAEYQRGIALHLEIDRFTDSHSIVRQSLRRYSPQWRRYGGILTDIFYDHFLALQWERYSELTLDQFSDEVFAAIDHCSGDLPPEVSERLERMKGDDPLRSYREIGGIRAALERVNARLKKPVGLGGAIAELTLHFGELEADFAEFFPLLQARVTEMRK